MEDLTSATFFGAARLTTALIFSSSLETWPKNEILLTENIHLSLLSLTPTAVKPAHFPPHEHRQIVFFHGL